MKVLNLVQIYMHYGIQPCIPMLLYCVHLSFNPETAEDSGQGPDSSGNDDTDMDTSRPLCTGESFPSH